MLQRYDYILPEIALIAAAAFIAVAGAGILRAPAIPLTGGGAPVATMERQAPAAPSDLMILVLAPGAAAQFALNGTEYAGLPELRTALQAAFSKGIKREAAVRLQGGEASFTRMRGLIEMLAELGVSFHSEAAK